MYLMLVSCDGSFGNFLSYDMLAGLTRLIMSLPPQKFREMLFQMLYCCDYSSSEEEDLVPLMMNELKVTSKAAKEAYLQVQKILSNLEQIDPKIGTASTEYAFERISGVEKNILRLGVHELFYDQGLHMKIVIAEAIRLCRKFGTPESAQFVHAVLDAIYKGSLCPSNAASNPTNC
jgi:N utilization substance protein B